MTTATYIVISIIILIIAAAIIKIYRDKKKGVKCIGCPMADSCVKKENISTIS